MTTTKAHLGRIGGAILGRGKGDFAGRALRLAAAAAIGSVAFAIAGAGSAQPSGAGAAATNPIWLEQNWTPEQRDRYHHQSQGTLTLPIPASWFLALQQPDISPRAGLFSDQKYLDRFGFIPSAAGPLNRDNLPIGFARTSGADPRDPTKRLDGIGFTCAACHTGRLEFAGKSIIVDGGPAIIDLGAFGKSLGLALGMTLAPTRFERFADRVVGSDREARRQLRRQLDAVVKLGLGELLQGQKGVAEGAGRLDALNRIGNKVFGEGLAMPGNNVPITAPVAYPHIWDTAWFDWVQYNGSIRQPMVRNAGEAMGVGAVVNYKAGPTPRFTSTIPIRTLHDDIEEVLGGATSPLPARAFSGLRPPAWPESVLGRIDRPLADRGEALYGRHCASCHGPAPGTEAFWTSNRWKTAPDTAGQSYLTVPNIPISMVGTDPEQAARMMARTVLVPNDLGLDGGTPAAGNMRRYGFADALKQVVEKVANRWYDAQTPPVSAADRERLDGFRANIVRGEMAYKARPLDGIWATPPYLHNGSVLTLWELLSPLSERRRVFFLGGRQYDARWVGYVSGGSFKLDTSKPANSNAGHVFDGPVGGPRGGGIIGAALSTDERRALVEYLKRL